MRINLNPIMIDRADRVVKKFLAHSVLREIDPTTPEEVISVIKKFPNRKALDLFGITNSAISNLPI